MAAGPRNGVAHKIMNNEATEGREEPEERIVPRVVISSFMTDRGCKKAIIADKTLERAGVPESIERIRDECFSHGNVKTVNIPASVLKITGDEGDQLDGWTGRGAFYGCENLQRVIFAEGSQLKEIGRNAFFRCSMLLNIILPESVETLGEYSFY